MIKWGLVTFACGIALIIVEIMMARKKKGGITATDRRSMMGLFWITLAASGLVMFLVSGMSD